MTTSSVLLSGAEAKEVKRRWWKLQSHFHTYFGFSETGNIPKCGAWENFGTSSRFPRSINTFFRLEFIIGPFFARVFVFYNRVQVRVWDKRKPSEDLISKELLSLDKLSENIERWPAIVDEHLAEIVSKHLTALSLLQFLAERRQRNVERIWN